MEENLRTYSSLLTLYKYRYRSRLYPLEETLFADVIHSRSLCVLDLGVGTGRTSAYFQEFPSYVGLDYSPVMVEWCRKRFRDSDGKRFVLGDARAIPFANASFNVVIFSFNGLDYVSPEDRKMILREVSRVLTPKGAFLFSTHNIRSLSASRKIPRGVLGKISEQWRMLLIRALNRRMSFSQISRGERAMVRDMPTLVTHYISLSAQKAELSESGFAIRKVFDEDGSLLYPSEGELEARGKWFYIFAEKAEQ